ncbi:hypothetical protein ACLK2H_21585 [Escherichia coli]
MPALFRALKDKAPFWIEKFSELPELVYDSLRQSKQMQASLAKISQDMATHHTRQGQSRYLFGIGAVLLLSGTVLLVYRPEWA